MKYIFYGKNYIGLKSELVILDNLFYIIYFCCIYFYVIVRILWNDILCLCFLYYSFFFMFSVIGSGIWYVNYEKRRDVFFL